MKQANCSLTPEGYPIIFFTALGTLAFAMLGCTVMTVIFLVLCWFSLNFFRDPERVVPAEPMWQSLLQTERSSRSSAWKIP